MLVSVIIPVYNMEKRLEKCVNSIINQTYKNIQIIFINDGSTDDSLKILKKYKQRDNRIIIINQQNKGISAARNIGLEKANGEFITFVDSDDYIEFNMIEELVLSITKNNSDIVVCDYYTFNDLNIKNINHVGNKYLFESSLNKKPELISQIDFAPWNKIYKRQLFNKISFPIKTKYEDFETILKVFSKANKISKLDLPLYDYYINEKGETRLGSKKNMDMLVIMKNLNEYFDFDGDDKNLKSEFFKVSSEKLLNSTVSIFKICSLRICLKYIDDVYKFLNTSCHNWHELYKNNSIDSNYIKFIRGNKIVLKIYAFLRITTYKLLSK